MSYQIVNNPSSITDIFGVLAQELTDNSYTVERSSEVVGSETCISWTDGSGLYFHVDWNGSDVMYTSISTGYVAGTLGRSQAGAEYSNYIQTYTKHDFSDSDETIIVVTDDLIYLKQDVYPQYKPAFQFSKSYFYSKGTQWCVTNSSYNNRNSGGGFNPAIFETLSSYRSGFSNNYTYSYIVYYDGSSIVKQGNAYSDTAFNGMIQPNSQLPGYDYDGVDSWLGLMLVDEYYSTLAKPLRVYINGQPFAKINNRLVIGRGDNLLDNKPVQIAGNNYISTYRRTSSSWGGRPTNTQEVVLIRYD
ncbi:hypothetical protein LO80_03150 [Candidatus Francisella endociliophora]|uniref:Uncharacterized protein n=1 Tax=Candidatus Francisella endociliophora TaxID=653937 RepID=A0A097END2_9GAMM|nr:hypothetical protein [Francisella sp. FSC1006]AIT09069.1 hypothetical protein LO80_03150 [Francisella sp. FSC1006]